MKYYIDTEFLEGKQKEKFPISLFRKETPNTIDLISIGIVCEDGRELYIISKDFNLKEAWNREWIRANVLEPIYFELLKRRGVYEKTYHWGLSEPFSYKSMKYLLKCYGKTNNQIKSEVLKFTLDPNDEFYNWHLGTSDEYFNVISKDDQIRPEFYAYYADYDWVVFCWLFGKMINLPKGFPMYCRDLKQIFDQEAYLVEDMNLDLKNHPNYPKQTNEHSAIDDARWNKKLHEFLISAKKK